MIGRRCKDVEAADALDAIAGYMLLNDLSARDLQFATPQWMPGKVFDGSAPCGPALVTPDEAGAPDAISFALDLNGERMQEASTSDLVFSVPELVARLSRWMTLEPGDIVSTGTPVRGRQHSRAAGLAQARGRDRDLLADPRRAAHDDRLGPTRSAPRTSSSMRAVDARGVLLQPLHFEVAEADQPHPRGGGDGGAAHRVVEHARLAEDVAGAEVGDVLAVASHLGGARPRSRAARGRNRPPRPRPRPPGPPWIARRRRPA